MKKILLILLSITLLSGCFTSSKTFTTYETEQTEIHALITSDIHYVKESESASAIVSLVGYSDDFMQCLMNQVINEHPDVFIITGDITNNGKLLDIQNLVPYLKQIKDAGIQLIMTTGNHDYDNDDMTNFESYFFPLFDIDSRDADSLSYTSIINEVCIIAMDDGSATQGSIGSFSRETMQWLEEQLNTAKENQQKIIFLSHHSVLYDDPDTEHRYTITNTELKSLLEQYQVELCFTGHQHGQARLEENNIHEIISAMPQNGSHLIGNLQIVNNTVTYETEKIDFNAYADENLLSLIHEEHSSSQDEIYLSLFSKEQYTEDERIEMLSLFKKILLSTQDGTISHYYNEIKNDPYFDLMLEALSDTNYGPWIETMMESLPLDASYLTFEWS